MSEVVNVPNGWARIEIKKICDIGRGRVISEKEIKNNIGIYPVYSSQTNNNGQMGQINTFDFEGEYVTWTTDGANAGTVFYRNGKFNCTNVCGTLQNKDGKIHHHFLAYQLSTISKKYVSYVGNPKLMNNTMGSIEIKLPKSKKEQEKIAEILSEVDSAIEHAQALHVKHQKIKTALMQDLLTHGIDSNGKIRNPKTHTYKPSPLGDIPVEWNTDKLKNIASIIVSNVDKKSFNNEIHVKLCNYMDVYSNTYITNTISFMNATATNAEIRNFQLTQDDVVVTKDSESPFDIGIPAYILTNVENLICGYHLAILRTQKDILLGSWLSSILTIDYYKNYFASTASGSTRFGLPKSALENILVKFPNSKEEQQKIAQILSSHDEKIEKVKTKLEKLKQLKTALMQDLLSGTKRVNHLLGEEQ